MSFKISYEFADHIFEYRSLKKLEDSFYCGKLLFFMNPSLSKMHERDANAESHLEKIAHAIKE